jgi:sec-independent protein translocase protein TatB
MFGLTFEKIVLIGVVAAFLLGPERLPYYASQLARLVKKLKQLAEGAKERLGDEMGEEIDWKQLDPRQYDPRRIIRAAISDEAPAATPTIRPPRPAAEPVVTIAPRVPIVLGTTPRFDASNATAPADAT